jgi:hypothetical protein
LTLGRAKVTLVQHTDSCTGCPGSAGVGVILGLGARNPMARDHVCWEIGLEGYRVCFGVGFDVGARAKQRMMRAIWYRGFRWNGVISRSRDQSAKLILVST